MRKITSILIVVLGLIGAGTSGVSARSYYALGYPLIELEDVVRSGGELKGLASYKGEEHPCVLLVTRGTRSNSHSYFLRLVVSKAGREKPLVALDGELEASHQVAYGGDRKLDLDLTEWPASTKTRWHFVLGDEGTIESLLATQKGTLGLGKKEVSCRFAPLRQLNFEGLHGVASAP